MSKWTNFTHALPSAINSAGDPLGLFGGQKLIDSIQADGHKTGPSSGGATAGPTLPAEPNAPPQYAQLIQQLMGGQQMNPGQFNQQLNAAQNPPPQNQNMAPPAGPRPWMGGQPQMAQNQRLPRQAVMAKATPQDLARALVAK